MKDILNKKKEHYLVMQKQYQMGKFYYYINEDLARAGY